MSSLNPNPLRHVRLDRPVACLDLETTGTDTRLDRIVSLSIVKYAPRFDDRDWPDFGPTGHPVELTTLVNPGRPIPRAATLVHGITDDAVASAPSFARIAMRVASFLEGVDLMGFGLSRFDLPLLVSEFRRAEVPFDLANRSVVDVMKIFHKLEPRTLEAAVRRYLRREHEGAHGARADVLATVEVLDVMVGAHFDLPGTIEALHGFTHDVDVEGWFRREGDRVVFARGRHVGRTPAEVASDDRSYLVWVLRQQPMPDAQSLVVEALEAEDPEL